MEEEGANDSLQYYAVASKPSASSSSSSAPSSSKQPRASSRLSARRSKQASVEAERRAATTWSEAAAAAGDDGGVPLWRQLRAASDEARRRNGAKDREAKLAKQQRILQHIAWTRAEQDLPPVFAILRGPSLRPYRMEELSLTLGRVTPRHRVRLRRLLLSSALLHSHLVQQLWWPSAHPRDGRCCIRTRS
jgi:hypothetical protein